MTAPTALQFDYGTSASTNLTVFLGAEAKARLERDAAIQAVTEAAPDDWKATATAFLEAFLHSHETMHVDQLWEAGLVEPPELRALGGLFVGAIHRGWMVKTGEYRPSVRSHLSSKPVWRSLLYRGER